MLDRGISFTDWYLKECFSPSEMQFLQLSIIFKTFVPETMTVEVLTHDLRVLGWSLEYNDITECGI